MQSVIWWISFFFFFLSFNSNDFFFTEPIGGEITVASEPAMMKNTPKTAMEKALDEQLKASKFSTSVEKSQQRGCYYTSIPRVIKQKGIQGQELTSLNLDKVSIIRPLTNFSQHCCMIFLIWL